MPQQVPFVSDDKTWAAFKAQSAGPKQVAFLKILPQTPIPEPETRNTKHGTRNMEHGTPHPKPSTLNPNP